MTEEPTAPRAESIEDHVGNIMEVDEGWQAWCWCAVPFEVREGAEAADTDLHDHMRAVVARLSSPVGEG